MHQLRSKIYLPVLTALKPLAIKLANISNILIHIFTHFLSQNKVHGWFSLGGSGDVVLFADFFRCHGIITDLKHSIIQVIFASSVMSPSQSNSSESLNVLSNKTHCTSLPTLFHR